MKRIHKQMMLAVVAACAVVAPGVQGAPTAQEVFSQLAERQSPAAAPSEQRATVLPALALLPAQADAVFVAAKAGRSAVELMQLMDCKCKAGEAQMGSIGSLAVSMGGGSAAAFERALPAIAYASQLGTLEEWEKRWCEYARPELVKAIQRAFAGQKEQVQRNLRAVLADYRPQPVYAAFTAAPEFAEDFQNLCRSVQQSMQRATQGGDWQSVEMAGYTSAIRTTQLHACKSLLGVEPGNEELRQDLAQRSVYLLLKVYDGAMVLILCEQPGNVTLPDGAGEALLNTPMLAGADAHMAELRAAAWVSPRFFKVLQKSLYEGKNPLSLALADAFRNIGEIETAQQEVYLSASRNVLQLDSPPTENIPDITRPMEMQVWQPSPELLRSHMSMDAWGARFEPGELRLAARAMMPDTIYYAETTAVASPYMPRTKGRWQELMSVGQAAMLTLREDKRAAVAPYLHGLMSLAPEAQALETSLQAIGDALGTPLAVVSGDGAPGEDPAVAVCAAVKNRAGLAEGWKMMLQGLGQVAAKFGFSPAVATELPIESRALGDKAASHTLHLPFLPKGMTPNVAVSDSYVVLGYSPTLNERLLTTASSNADRMPFSGAVCAISFSGWAKTARTMTERSEETKGTAMRITRFLERLAAKATLYLHATTIQDGAVVTGSSMHLK